ncbi:MAG: folate-binding protein YgfZ [Acidobacteria bacterium]|nr:folate-binding protein YgfZ [Acidobacteriota bacterium]
MTMTQLTKQLSANDQNDYRGCPAVSVYSDIGKEFRALVHKSGMYELAWRSKLLVTGKDRTRWLNGMVSNNVRDLGVGQGVYSFLLTPQGRILADLYIYNRGDFLLLDTDQSQVENLVANLRRYIIMDQVEIRKAGDQWKALGVTGPDAHAVVSHQITNVKDWRPLQIVETNWRDTQLAVVHFDLAGVDSYEIWLDQATLTRLWQELLKQGAIAIGCNAFELFRIACGVPVYGHDIRERDLPQETGQMRALSFTKGCYIGQEIVERIRSRGAVHRKFTGFTIDGPLPAVGSKAQAEGKEIAEITSAATLPCFGGDRQVALGYIRREFATPENTIEIGGAKATVVDLPSGQVFTSGQER